MKAWFVHGWAFGPEIWRDLAPLLPKIEPVFADRCYFGAAEFSPPQEPAIWITHSFGTMLALQNMSENCRALIAINGFDRFSASAEFPGVPPRLLDRMLARFEAQPVAVVSDFRARCGADAATPVLSENCLREDLTALRDDDCRELTSQLRCPVLSLQAANDPILPQSLREAALHSAPNARHITHPSAGHLLPLEDPQWCARAISEFLLEAAPC